MPVEPKLRRIVNAPAVPPSNLLLGPNAAAMTLQAARCQLARSDPSSCLRDPHTQAASGSRMQLLTVHPNQPLIAYVLEQKTTTTLSSSLASAATKAVSAGVVDSTEDDNNNDETAGKQNTPKQTQPSDSQTAAASAASGGGDGGDIGGGSDNGDSLTITTTTKLIQVQHLQTRNVIWSLSLDDLANLIFDNYSVLSKDAYKKHPSALKSLGRILSISFFDPSTLYFNGMQMMMPSSTSPEDDDADMEWEKDDFYAQQPQQQQQQQQKQQAEINHLTVARWQALLVQFQTRIVMLNLRKGPNSIALVPTKVKNTASTWKDAYTPIYCHLNEKTGLNSPPSSNALPITDSLLLLGCMDGTFKCYDWKRSKLLKSIKGLGKNDWIAYLIAANAPFDPKFLKDDDALDDDMTMAVGTVAENDGGGTGSSGNNVLSDLNNGLKNKKNKKSQSNSSLSSLANTPASTSASNLNAQAKCKDQQLVPGGHYKRRFIALTKKGTAYLIEIIISKKKSDHSISVDIRPPLVRFEGGAPPPSTTAATEETDAASAAAGGTIMDHAYALIKFDPERQLFLWNYPAQKGGAKYQKVLCWELARFEAQIQEQNQDSNNNSSSGTNASGNSNNDGGTSAGEGGSGNDAGSTTNPSSSSGGGSSSSSSHKLFKPEATTTIQYPFLTPVGLLPGWNHPDFPEDVMMSAAVTTTGELHILGAKVGTSGITSAVTVNSTNLAALLQRDTGLGESSTVIQVHFIGCPNLWDSSMLLVGSNIGLMMIDFDSDYKLSGTRHYHFGAGLGSLGKSALMVHNSTIVYGSIDTFKPNPFGTIKAKTPKDLYESPLALHLPAEVHKRSFRMPPCFIPSPSGLYLCVFWTEEMRYEILHVPTLLQPVTKRGNFNNSSDAVTTSIACVASGIGVSSFAWVTERDVYCLLHSPQEAVRLGQPSGIDAPIPTAALSDAFQVAGPGIKDVTKDIGAHISDLKVQDLAKIGTATISGAKAVGKVSQKLALGTAKVTSSTGKHVGSALTKVATFGLVDIGKKKEKKKQQQQQDLSTVLASGASGGVGAAESNEDFDEDLDDENMSVAPPAGATASATNYTVTFKYKKPTVEYRILIPVPSDDTTTTAGQIGSTGNKKIATSSTLGELELRGGSRIPPVALFGGPVLCVASRSEEDNDGYAHFYTKRKSASSTTTDGADNKNTDKDKASEWMSSGPTMPFPDLVVWDDDGRLCAVVIHNRVAIYLSDEPDFILMGTVRAGLPADPDGSVTSAKFVHGVLYCCTRNSIQVVFLGNISSSSSLLCHLDTYILASTDVPTLPSKAILTSYSSLTPPTIPMPLNNPSVLGYQNGSLMVSMASKGGLVAIPLIHPLLRIGSLLAVGQLERAMKWFNAVPESDHEELATFLERRGVPEVAKDLPGLSLETIVDFCMRYGYVQKLEEVVESFGVKGLRTIDLGRSLSSNIFGPEEYGHSLVVCVGAYLLAHGRIELVRRLTSDCLRLAAITEDGKKEAFVLSALLLNVVDGNDARRLIGRAVQADMNIINNSGEQQQQQSSSASSFDGDWIIGSFVRDHILTSSSESKEATETTTSMEGGFGAFS